EKLQLPAFFPTQHRCPNSSVQPSESETSDFFNSPRGTDFSPERAKPRAEGRRCSTREPQPAADYGDVAQGDGGSLPPLAGRGFDIRQFEELAPGMRPAQRAAHWRGRVIMAIETVVTAISV